MTKKIAIVAHNRHKQEALSWATKHKHKLYYFELIATAGTAKLISDITNLPVEAVLHGPDGGDIQLANAVLQGTIEAVVFFQDVQSVQAHQSDIDAFIRTCLHKNIPLALNRSTADILINQLSINVSNQAREKMYYQMSSTEYS